MPERTLRRILPAAIVSTGVIILAFAVWLNLDNGEPSLQSDLQSGNVPVSLIPRVNLTNAKLAFDQGSAIFLDVRATTAFADSHIPGAISIPEEDLESRSDELDPNEWIIPYCT